jgi:hypothetical protein
MKDSELTGKRVALIRMEDPYTTLRPGAKGTVKGEDDMGHILVNWDSGSSLSLIPEIDEYEILEESRILSFGMFNEDLNSSEANYVHTKCSELIDLFKNEYNVGVGIHIMSNSVQFKISLNDDRYLFVMDFDSQRLYMMVTYGRVGSPEDVHKDEEWSFIEIDEAFDILEKEIYKILGISEKVKSQRYKGHKIPGKYLTKNPGKMKKEIDTFRGKKEYKKDWDADYTSGKGGVGKRVKTKKSAATKAYRRMFGDK